MTSAASAPLPLDGGDEKELLRIAHATLREYLNTGYLPPGAPHRKPLLELRGACVNVRVSGELRGCAGRLEADRPIYLAVEELMVEAATRDPRFEPVRLEELRETQLEISVLSWLAAATPDQVEVGRHGVAITRGARRGFLLPAVAVERGWDRERFLDEACGKAGLAAGEWKNPGARLEVFTAQIFGD